MSDFKPRVVRLSEENVRPHPNADMLSIADVEGFPVVFKTENFPLPCLAAYIPEDSVMPESEEWAFLGSSRTVVSKKLRGVLSIGMLAPLPNGMGGGLWSVGDDVTEAFGITKKVEPDMVLQMQTENEHCPFHFPKYTDLESFAKIQTDTGSILDGKQVVISEKLHGSNARYVYKDGRLWVGSRGQVKAYSESNLWWRAAKEYNLEEKLSKIPNIVVFGEVYGSRVQGGFPYDAVPGQIGFRVFDMFNLDTGKWLDDTDVLDTCTMLSLLMVPYLYVGEWSKGLIEEYSGGSSILGGTIREGFVVKLAEEDVDELGNRIAYKVIGNEYREKKGKKKVNPRDAAISALQARVAELEDAVQQLRRQMSFSNWRA